MFPSPGVSGVVCGGVAMATAAGSEEAVWFHGGGPVLPHLLLTVPPHVLQQQNPPQRVRSASR